YCFTNSGSRVLYPLSLHDALPIWSMLAAKRLSAHSLKKREWRLNAPSRLSVKFQRALASLCGCSHGRRCECIQVRHCRLWLMQCCRWNGQTVGVNVSLLIVPCVPAISYVASVTISNLEMLQ